jgi:acetylornithine deacetylase/succinyl-diaminopimelate desuccinylase-like protein
LREPGRDPRWIATEFSEALQVKGAKTVLPSSATAKISMRLVPNQDPEKIAKLIYKRYIKQLAPKSVKVKVTNLHGGYPVATPLDDPATRQHQSNGKSIWKKTVFIREGGSIPIVTVFAKKLKSISSSDGLRIKY